MSTSDQPRRPGPGSDEPIEALLVEIADEPDDSEPPRPPEHASARG